MKKDLLIENLLAVIEDLNISLKWLNRSYKICGSISKLDECTEDQIDDTEAFMSRFARSSDILIQKVLRAIDAVEFEKSSSLIDAANHAEKRGIIESVTALRTIREVRNLVAHEYAAEDFQELFNTIRQLTPELIAMAEKAMSYCQRFK